MLYSKGLKAYSKEEGSLLLRAIVHHRDHMNRFLQQLQN